MSSHETDIKFAAAGYVGILEDSSGKSPVIGVISNDDSAKRVLLDHIEGETGFKLEPVEEIPGVQSSMFGFTNWGGSSWIPEGPRPNWKVPEKLN